jgi:hypothetical protein
MNWHQYYCYLEKHRHLLTKKIRVSHGGFFNVTTINNSLKRGGRGGMARSQLGFKAMGASMHFKV